METGENQLIVSVFSFISPHPNGLTAIDRAIFCRRYSAF